MRLATPPAANRIPLPVHRWPRLICRGASKTGRYPRPSNDGGSGVNVLKPHLCIPVRTLPSPDTPEREIERRTGVDCKTICSHPRAMAFRLISFASFEPGRATNPGALPRASGDTASAPDPGAQPWAREASAVHARAGHAGNEPLSGLVASTDRDCERDAGQAGGANPCGGQRQGKHARLFDG